MECILVKTSFLGAQRNNLQLHDQALRLNTRLANATAEVLWICSLLQELHYHVKSASTLWCDNLSAIYLTANPVFHSRMKHVEIDFHFVRELIAWKSIQVKYLSTVDQVADIFTKGLSSQKHMVLTVGKNGLEHPYFGQL